MDKNRIKIIKPIINMSVLFILIISVFFNAHYQYNNLTVSTVAEDPIFSKESGFYDFDFNLEIFSSPGSTVYYTTDSSNPTVHSHVYSKPILIFDASVNDNVASANRDISTIDVFIPEEKVDKCTVIKAISIDSKGNKSNIVTKVYFVGFNIKNNYKNYDIISLSLEPEDLFGYTRGIYVKGRNFRGSKYTANTNYNNRGPEWEREATLTFFDKNKAFSFQQNIGIRIHGGWSRTFNQKGFNLYSREEYSGSNYFINQLLLNKTESTAMLRTGGFRDFYLTKIRDILNQKLLSNRSFSCQESKPVVLFLNGEYWGLYNLQERFSENYVYNHFGVDENNVIIITSNFVECGLEEDIRFLEETIDFFKNNNFSSLEQYLKACEYIDINSFIDYVCGEIYIGNIDWPVNNFRMWRSRTVSDKPFEDGKWRFMMYDTDDCANIVGSSISNMTTPSTDSFLPEAHWTGAPLLDDSFVGLVFTKLLQNETFCSKFKNNFFEIADNNFDYDHVHELLYSLADQYDDQMVSFYHRFVSDSSEYNLDYFYEEIKNIDVFFENRKTFICEYMIEHIDNKDFLKNESIDEENKDDGFKILEFIQIIVNESLLFSLCLIIIVAIFLSLVYIDCREENK